MTAPTRDALDGPAIDAFACDGSVVVRALAVDPTFGWALAAASVPAVVVELTRAMRRRSAEQWG
jgi:hypothetical protein